MKQLDGRQKKEMKKTVMAFELVFAALGAWAWQPALDTLIAHRGESYDAPENTLPAYEMAVERGFGFECDVYLSTDGRVFSFHDPNLKRTTGVDLDCNKASWEETVSKIDAGGWKGEKWKGTRPALLEEILALARDGRYIYLEIKTGPEIVPYIKRLIEAQTRANAGNLLFISFNEASLKAVKEQMPEYKAFLLQGDISAEAAIEKCRALGIDGMDLCYDSRRITAEYARKLNEAGLELHVWTVDSLAGALSAFARGVKSVTTNCAKKLKDEFDSRPAPENDLNGNGWTDIYENPAAKVEDRVHDLWGQMTLDEKIGQLNMPFCEKGRPGDILALAEKGGMGALIYHGESVLDRNEIQKHALVNSRLGVPVLFCLDVIHGAETIFPIAPALAGAFEPELFEKAARVAAKEAKSHGIDAVFAPDCDVAIDPRWGRVAETCGEDPYLASKCVAAQVKGLKALGVAACLKHFAGYSAVVGGRDYNEAEIGTWTLRNLHLPPFKAGVDAGAGMVMASFNTIDGVPSVANRWLLTDILKGEWNFKGAVTADWNGVGELKRWGLAEGDDEAAAMALNAGCDFDMTSSNYVGGLKDAIRKRLVKESQIDEAVKRVLKLKFENVEWKLENEKREDVGDRDQFERLARECAQKSIVMLKNDGALPISGVRKVALVGPLAENLEEPIGCWVIWPRRAKETIADALRRELGEGVEVVAVKGCDVGGDGSAVRTDGTIAEGQESAVSANALGADAITQVPADVDLIILALGEARGLTGENTSRCTLGLTGRQEELFREAVKTGRPIVTVVFSGRPLVLPEVWEKSSAMLYAWQLGTEAAAAVANVLTGKASPEARLSMSVPKGVGVVPVNYNHAATGRHNMGGYREYGREREPLAGYEAYPFGFGLTYTTFSYGEAKVEEREGRTVVSAQVRNTGKRDGVETVQMYVREKVCREGARPVKELRGFRKVSLKPGESANVEFTLDETALGYVARDGSKRCDDGEYEVWVAPDSKRGKPVTAYWRRAK